MHRIASLFLLLAVSTFAADSALREQVTTLFNQRQWAEAQTMLEKVVAATPDNAEAYFYLGQCQLNRGDFKNAVAVFEKATTLAPAKSEYFRLLGDSYGVTAQKAGLFAKFGWAKKCKAAYDKSVELDPTNINARWSVMEYCRQAPGFVGGGMDGAYAQAAEIKKLDPARGRIAYASLYTADKKFPEAFAVYEEVLKDEPNDYSTLYQVGKLADTTGQELDRGLAALRRCLTLTPTDPRGYVPAHWRIGNILLRKGDKAGARAAYETALKLNPNFTEAIESLKKLN
ncbi:MAG TPA: tetratricopeptide repeat protein [Opitutaceae bacterium]|nr:tetratricopeptide repeat protein [Opitutaceae bacterium]